MTQEEIDIQLLDFLSGNMSQEECAKIESWIYKTPENKAYFEYFRAEHLKMRWACRHRLIRQDRFELVQEKLNRRLWWRRSWQVAATVVMLVGAGSLAYFLQTPSIEKPDLMADIRPGKPQATLILSSGESVAVQAIRTELKESDGTAIQVEQNGEICYTASEKAKESSEVMYNRMVIPRGGEFAMQLEDGTKVWLNAATELKYPIIFKGDKRIVYLKGEAYFEVAPDRERPFIVATDQGMEIEVYGTEFNVNAYQQEIVQTVLVKGSVGIRGAGGPVRLSPGQKAEYQTGNREIEVENVDVTPYIAWKEGNFVFQNEPLEQILEKLARWYDVEVIYTSDSLRRIRLSGDMKRYDEMKDLLYFLEKGSNVNFEIKDRTLTVTPSF